MRGGSLILLSSGGNSLHWYSVCNTPFYTNVKEVESSLLRECVSRVNHTGKKTRPTELICTSFCRPVGGHAYVGSLLAHCQRSAKLLAAKMPEISVRTIEAYFELSCLSQHDFKLCVLCR